ncbi:hypothetical protein D3C76_713900 [compost metagenome]
MPKNFFLYGVLVDTALEWSLISHCCVKLANSCVGMSFVDVLDVSVLHNCEVVVCSCNLLVD